MRPSPPSATSSASRRARAQHAEDGAPKTKSAVTVPGRTVVQRANKFTNYAGTFLYVEAHNKDIVRTAWNQQHVHGPDPGRLVQGRHR